MVKNQRRSLPKCPPNVLALGRESSGSVSSVNSRSGTPPPQQRVVEIAHRLTRTMGVARALAENGRSLDLSGFQDGVGILVAHTLDLGSAEARTMLPILHDVLGQLDSLSHALRGEQHQAPGHPGERRQLC